MGDFTQLNDPMRVWLGLEPSRPLSAEGREAVLVIALSDLLQLCEHATFDNGVTAPDGRNEADYWAAGAIDSARTLLRQYTEHQDFPEPRSVLASRLKYRLDVLIERAGTEEAAITSRGIGISYLFARELYNALAKVGTPACQGPPTRFSASPLPPPKETA